MINWKREPTRMVAVIVPFEDLFIFIDKVPQLCEAVLLDVKLEDFRCLKLIVKHVRLREIKYADTIPEWPYSAFVELLNTKEADL